MEGLHIPSGMLDAATATPAQEKISFVWLEITGKCQLGCEHCYADSGPKGSHGTMTLEHWQTVIGDARELGVGMVQFIGGEPTLHPHFADLVEHALGKGLKVEVFSNLVRVTDRLWDVFSKPGVSLATSYYSNEYTEHESITGRRGYATERNSGQHCKGRCFWHSPSCRNCGSPGRSAG